MSHDPTHISLLPPYPLTDVPSFISSLPNLLSLVRWSLWATNKLQLNVPAMGQAHRWCRLCLRRPRQPRQLLWLLVDPSLIRNATPAILSPVRCLRLSLMSLSIIGQTPRSRSRSRSRHRHRSLLSSVTGLIGFISHRNRLSPLLFEPSLCPALLFISCSFVIWAVALACCLCCLRCFSALLP